MAKVHRSVAMPGVVAARSPAKTHVGMRAAMHDPRWPAVAAALRALREQGRCAVRIVDADCGAGGVLLHALQYARALGFTAIEGRGIDGSPSLVGRARAAAGGIADPAIGVVFELADLATALAQEYECPADIVLWHGTERARARADVSEIVAHAGDLAIADRHTLSSGKVAR